MESNKALILGGSGQDGIFLNNYLTKLGYKVLSTKYKNVINNVAIANLNLAKPNFVDLEIRNLEMLEKVIRDFKPSEIYNFAGLSSVSKSFLYPEITFQVNIYGFLNLIKIIRNYNKDIKLFQACSSEMFGDFRGKPFNEDDSLIPVSPYGISKAICFDVAKYYRSQHNLRIYCGILFNHESELRRDTFVTKKIIRGLVQISKNRAKKLTLGNLDISRDWGYAGEYVEAVFNLIQLNKPTDLVIATGISHSLKDFIIQAMQQIGIKRNINEIVYSSENLFREKEIHFNSADISLAKKLINWQPRILFKDLIERLVQYELTLLQKN